MRVLHYRQTFSKTSETFLYAYLKELEQQGVDNHVLTHDRRNPESRSFPCVKEASLRRDSQDTARCHSCSFWARRRVYCVRGEKV